MFQPGLAHRERRRFNVVSIRFERGRQGGDDTAQS